MLHRGSATTDEMIPRTTTRTILLASAEDFRNNAGRTLSTKNRETQP